MTRFKRGVVALLGVVMLLGVLPAGAISQGDGFYDYWHSGLDAAFSSSFYVAGSSFNSSGKRVGRVFFGEQMGQLHGLSNGDGTQVKITGFNTGLSHYYSVDSSTLKNAQSNGADAISLNFSSEYLTVWSMSIPVYTYSGEFVGYWWPQLTPITASEVASLQLHDAPYSGPTQNEDWEGTINLRLRIVEPLDGASFSGTNKVRMLVNYKYPEKYSKMELGFIGFKEDKYQIVSDKVYPVVEEVDQTILDPSMIQNNKISLLQRAVVVEGYLDQDTPVTIKAWARQKQWYLPEAWEPYCEDSVTVTCYSDFVDANGDGLDDRTGKAKGDIDLSGGDLYPGYEDDQGADNPVPGDSMTTTIDTSSLSSIFNGMSGFSSNFINFLGSFFSYLPAQFITLIVFGMAVVVAMRILGR